MLFSFLKYVKPISYFHLKQGKEYIFPDLDSLSDEIINKIEKYEEYSNEISIRYDMLYQCVEKGYIGNEKRIETIKKLPVSDEYKFIRRYFNPLWSFYVFIIRVLTLNNPLKEIIGLFSAFQTKRTPLYEDNIEHNDFKTFILKESPLISVIIPTLNRYEYLKDVLIDLENQSYKNFEVIVVDQSEPLNSEFFSEFTLNINLIAQKEKALWLARNTAIEESRGDYILLFDDDSRVNSDWIVQHLKCIEYFKADISSGVSLSKIGDKIPENYKFFKYSDQLDTGNVLIRRNVFKEIGLFDRQFERQRMGDGEFGLRAHINGFKNISNHLASRIHLKVATGGLRQMGSWDAFRPKKWLAPRPIPSVIYFFMRYYGKKPTIFELIRSVPPSIISYKYKGNKLIFLLSFIPIVIIMPLMILQVRKSWLLAKIKINEGPKIKLLK